ncbi:MAG: CD225/dispanin family protein, partial [Eubacteriales bacterium]|nr:CD225/dispanin family protein [Eubacteriales bacterium]
YNQNTYGQNNGYNQNNYNCPTPNNYGQNNYNPYGGYNQMPSDPPGSSTYLILSILELIFCGVLWGGLALYNSSSANTAYKNGDMQTFESKRRTARIFLIIGVVVNVVIFFFSFIAALMA